MKKYLVFSFLATILFTACDDTRQAMHDEYLEFVMHTDSLETVHEAMVVSHEAVKADTRTLAQKLKDVEATDSIAMADVREHQMQLKAQATSLAKLKKLIESHADVKGYFMSDSISVEQMEQQLLDMEANNEEIAARLNQIKTELQKIEAEQEILKNQDSEE